MKNNNINKENLIEEGFTIRMSGADWEEYIYRSDNPNSKASIVVYIYDNGSVSVYPNSEICPFAKTIEDINILKRLYLIGYLVESVTEKTLENMGFRYDYIDYDRLAYTYTNSEKCVINVTLYNGIGEYVEIISSNKPIKYLSFQDTEKSQKELLNLLKNLTK